MMAEDYAALEKLREFIHLNGETCLLYDELQRRKCAVENVVDEDDKKSARGEAYAAHVSWFSAYSQLFKTVQELLKRDYIPIETDHDLTGLADLRRRYFYGGMCGIKRGEADEPSLRSAASRLGFTVFPFPLRQDI